MSQHNCQHNDKINVLNIEKVGKFSPKFGTIYAGSNFSRKIEGFWREN
jgi:hypothetical protein